MKPTNKELKDEVAQEIRKCLSVNVVDEYKCETIRDTIVTYLSGLKSDLIPVVKVENEGPFITINFFDGEGKRLETLEDVLSYMNNVVL